MRASAPHGTARDVAMTASHPSARWDAFLSQVRERFLDIVREAREGCPALLEQADFDPIPMSNAWGAIEMRAKLLESKIADTWSGQVEATFEAAGAPPDAVAWERTKGVLLRDWLEIERERARIAIFADAGQKLFERAKAEHERPFSCTRCGAPLNVPFTFRALNVTCPHCTTVNGFEPGTRMRMGEVYVHPLCEEAAFEPWLAMHRAEKTWRRSRDPNIDILKVWERAQIAFFRAYLRRRGELLPDTTSAFDADLRGKLRPFYEQMERESAWIRAGRPREAL